MIFRKNGEVNKNLFIWAAISAFRSCFLRKLRQAQLPKRAPLKSKCLFAKLRKHNYAKQKIVYFYIFSGFHSMGLLLMYLFNNYKIEKKIHQKIQKFLIKNLKLKIKIILILTKKIKKNQR